MIDFLLNQSRPRLWMITFLLIAVVGLADWWVGNSVSLAVLYILPMLSGALILNVRGLAGLALLCSFVRYCFDTPGTVAEIALRFVFASSAYFATGLFLNALVTNRKVVMRHFGEIQHEQKLRAIAEQQMEMMISSSSAAILTISPEGSILAGNHAANELLIGPSTASESLVGMDIRQFIPVLADAVEMQVTPQTFRTDAQCLGRRLNGEVFQAHTWFSSYVSVEGPRLAAIVVDSSEEMREREGQKFQELARSTRMTAAALSHEIRNLSAAVSVLAANLNARYVLAADEDYRALVSLIKGLERVATLNLPAADEDQVEPTNIGTVLDDLRIIIEADWTEVDGAIHLPKGPLPRVWADPHGLLQVFLNIAQNSLRAVRGCDERVLDISVLSDLRKAAIRFSDSGPGVESPDRLFRPFDPTSKGSGLGLYISRSMARTYGGDLRFESSERGAVFVVELQVV